MKNFIEIVLYIVLNFRVSFSDDLMYFAIIIYNFRISFICFIMLLLFSVNLLKIYKSTNYESIFFIYSAILNFSSSPISMTLFCKRVLKIPDLSILLTYNNYTTFLKFTFVQYLNSFLTLIVIHFRSLQHFRHS